MLLWSSSPQSMKEELENIYVLLPVRRERLPAGALLVGWLTTRKFVVLVPDPIVFAPWSVLLDLGQLCESCQDTSHEADPRIGRSDVHQQPIAGLTLRVGLFPSSWGCVSFLVRAPSQVHRNGDVVDTESWTLKVLEWEGSQNTAEEQAINHVTIKLRSDDVERQSFFQVVSSGISLMARLHVGRWTTTDFSEISSTIVEEVFLTGRPRTGGRAGSCGFFFLLNVQRQQHE